MGETFRKYAEILKKINSPEVIKQLSKQDKRLLKEWTENLRYQWEVHARPNQLPPPGKWNTWILMMGRGTGKTRSGAEAVRWHVHRLGYRAVGFVAPTASDARDTMVDGKGGSSLLEISPPSEKVEFFPTKRKVTWGNGAQGHTYSAEEPERLRGPQHDLLWLEELASFRYLQETWDMSAFGLRVGKNPRRIITATPKPVPLIRDLVNRAVPYEAMTEDSVEDVVISRGSTMDNRDNLAPQFLEELKKKYEGTRLGRQEIYAEILDDNPNALFSQLRIDENRVRPVKGKVKPSADNRFEYSSMPQAKTYSTGFTEVIVSIDPSMSAETHSDETGILVMARGEDDAIYVLQDLSGIYSPNDWARTAINGLIRWKADCIVAEVNQGGDLVQNTIRSVEEDMKINKIPYYPVRASRGKISRAEPVGALEEQGRIHHVGEFPQLEDQLTGFSPGYTKSPDRLDAYVWGAHHLILQHEKRGFFIA